MGTAVASNPSLSLSYARGSRKLLVCGVLDSTLSTQVRHSGTAMVIFDERRVAPLFEASQSMSVAPPAPAPMRPVNSAVQNHRARKKRQKPDARLTGIAAFLARRAARKRRGPFDFRNGFVLQKSC